MRVLIFSLFVFSFASCTSYPVLKQYPTEVSNFDSKSLALADGSKAKTPLAKKDVATVLVLVRHAEKKKGGSDPALTVKGSERAVRLSELLREYQIEKIYSSNYQRTLETAEPLLKETKLGVEIYNPRKLEDLRTKILSEDLGKRILIVGHSNSTPKLVNLFTGESSFPKIDESDYSNLFHIEFVKPEKVRVTKVRFN